MKRCHYLLVLIMLTAVAVAPARKKKGDPSTISSIVVDPHITRYIRGVTQLHRRRYFCLSDPGRDFELRVKDEAMYDYLVHNLDISFGRFLGPVKNIPVPGKTLIEDRKRDYYADINALKKLSRREGASEKFRNDFGTNLNVVAHGEHNAYPKFMGRYYKSGAKHHRNVQEYLPKRLDPAAELAAYVLKYAFTDFERPAFFEPINEPHWTFYTDEHMAQWHLAIMDKVHELVPSVKVGGSCLPTAYFYRDNYKAWHTLQEFIDLTDCRMDFYSFHAYDYYWLSGDDFHGRVQSGLPLENVFDLIQNYTMNEYGKEVPLVISEQGGFITSKPRGEYSGEHDAAKLAAKVFRGHGFDIEMKKRSIVDFVHVSAMVANAMVFFDHPHVLQKSVPFVLLNAFDWDPRYYAVLYVPYEYKDKSRWVPTHMFDFFKFFQGMRGRRVKALATDPDLQTRAFVDGRRMYVAINNLSAEPERVRITGIDSDSITLRRLGRNEDYTPYLREEPAESLDVLTLAGREAVMIMADYDEEIEETGLIREIPCYGDVIAQPVKSKLRAKVKVPLDKEIDYAYLRVGISRLATLDPNVEIEFNDEDLDVPLEDCASRLDDGRRDYASTKIVPLDVAKLKKENKIEISFDKGQDGRVGAVVIRIGVKDRIGADD